jgi:hypothetical protein
LGEDPIDHYKKGSWIQVLVTGGGQISQLTNTHLYDDKTRASAKEMMADLAQRFAAEELDKPALEVEKAKWIASHPLDGKPKAAASAKQRPKAAPKKRSAKPKAKQKAKQKATAKAKTTSKGSKDTEDADNGAEEEEETEDGEDGGEDIDEDDEDVGDVGNDEAEESDSKRQMIEDPTELAQKGCHRGDSRTCDL